MDPTTNKQEILDCIGEQAELLESIKVSEEFLSFPKIAGYDIPRNSLRTEADIIRWTMHLAEKSWMTMPLLMHFMQVSCRLAGIYVGR